MLTVGLYWTLAFVISACKEGSIAGNDADGFVTLEERSGLNFSVSSLKSSDLLSGRFESFLEDFAGGFAGGSAGGCVELNRDSAFVGSR